MGEIQGGNHAVRECGGCPAHGEKEKKAVPYIAHEAALFRMEQQLKRSWILCIIIFLAFAVSNAAWIVYENQFEDVVTTVTQDLDSGSGGDAIINDGVHINGKGKADRDN